MDVLLLSRLQFAVATMFHFLFVPLTLGLSFLIAIMETKYAKTGDETYLRMTKFWGKLFLINFAVGVVTGISLEFQFGTNWSKYSVYVGDIFGSLLTELNGCPCLPPNLAINWNLDFWLEKTFKKSPRLCYVACCNRRKHFSDMDSYRKRMDAASCGVLQYETAGLS